MPPPSLSYSVSFFSARVGTHEYQHMCREAQIPENLDALVPWMVDDCVRACNYGEEPLIHSWLSDTLHQSPELMKNIRDAMSYPMINKWWVEDKYLHIMIVGIKFSIKVWYLGYALHMMRQATKKEGVT